MPSRLFLLTSLLLPASLAQNLVLRALPYAYDALEPYLDEATMRLHHLGHHAGYVTKANEALAVLRAEPSTKELAKSGLDAVLLRLAEVPEPQRTALRNAGGGVLRAAHRRHVCEVRSVGPISLQSPKAADAAHAGAHARGAAFRAPPKQACGKWPPPQ